MPYLRADQAEIHVGVNGINFPATRWQALDGGDVQAKSLNTRPGGIMPAVSLGGPTSRTDATVKRLYGTHVHAYVVALENVCGQARMWISYTPLDADGNTNGAKITMVGSLKQVNHPSLDANSSSAGVLSLVMDCDVEAHIG
jgi:hypothetical protein